MKRLGIFCTYDSDGVIDDYICYLLQETKKILDKLVIVCNGKLTLDGENKLKAFADDLIIRDNSGFDMEAWRQGILKYKDALKDYDELLIFNDSFYGSFYPFEEIFSRMDKEYCDADFWGVTVHGATKDKTSPLGKMPEHLQSYFLVVRERMFHSPQFFEYWQNATKAKTMDDAIKQHEVKFTKHFADLGFKYAAYCDTREMEAEYDTKVNHYLFSADKLLKDYRCPFLKKKIFLQPRSFFVGENYGNVPRDCLDFIEKNTDYDTALIWKNLLRKKNIGDLKKDLSLDYILPTELRIEGEANLQDAVIVSHLYYADLMPVCVEYLCHAPQEIKLVVTTNSADKKSLVEDLFRRKNRACEVRQVSARGRDLSALYVGCSDLFEKYKYVCFIHDKKSVREGTPIMQGEAFFKLLWDNILASETYIKNTLATFEKNPLLGVLAPPQPYNGEYLEIFFAANFWTTELLFNTTASLAEKLNIPTSFLDIKKAPPAIGSVFWCRTEAVKKLTAAAWKVEDFPAEPMPNDGTISHALERILPYVAQDAGFFTGQVMTDKFACNEVENFACLAKMFHDSPFKNVSSLTAWVKRVVPRRYWFLLKPLKNVVERCFKILKR